MNSIEYELLEEEFEEEFEEELSEDELEEYYENFEIKDLVERVVKVAEKKGHSVEITEPEIKNMSFEEWHLAPQHKEIPNQILLVLI